MLSHMNGHQPQSDGGDYDYDELGDRGSFKILEGGVEPGTTTPTWVSSTGPPCSA